MSKTTTNQAEEQNTINVNFNDFLMIDPRGNIANLLKQWKFED